MKSKTEVVSLDVLDLDTIRLQQEVIRLRRQIARLTRLLRLAIVVLQVSGFSFARVRLADGHDKQRLMHAIERTRAHVSLNTVLRAIGLSRARYHHWNNGEPCALDDRSSCPRSSPHQLTPEEVKTIREMATSQDYRHVPTVCLARLAQRIGKVFASSATWYRLVRCHDWRRPRQRIHPAKP